MLNGDEEKALFCYWKIRIIEELKNGPVCQCRLAQKFLIDSATLSMHLSVLKVSESRGTEEGRKKIVFVKN